MKAGKRGGADRVTEWLAVAVLCVLAGQTPGQGSTPDRETQVELYNATSGATSSQQRSSAIFVPVLLTSSGLNNSYYTSELTLTNRGGQEATLHYTYTAHRGGGSGTASETLASGRQKIVPDAIDYLRTLGIPIPSAGNRVGTLRVGGSGSSEVGLTVRTTTRVTDGQAGLAYPGIATAAGFEEAVYLCGLRQNSQDRSNVAIQNMGTAAEGNVTLRATVYSGDSEGADVLPEVTLEPGGFRQFNGILATAGFTQGFVKVERVGGRAPFYAYGVINDQANSDGSFIFPVAASSLVGVQGQTLPVIIEHPNFSSELILTNFSSSTRVIDFRFVAEAIESADRTARFSLTLPAGAQRIIPEIVEELRRQGVAGVGPSGRTLAGALFATERIENLGGVVIGARTGSPGGGGQYSVFYNAVPDGAAFSDTAWIEALQQNRDNRSNLALVNTGEVDASRSVFQLDIYDGETGQLVNTVTGLRVAARGWRQINGILDRYAPGTTQGYVRISKIAGNNPFLAYGVINDGGAPGQRSGDGAYLPPVREGIIDPGTEPMTDREVLEVLYNTTDGPNWRNAENWLTDAPLGDWYGVSTDAARRVVGLDLSGRWDVEAREWIRHGLSGPIPPELGNLTKLQWLNLADNQLSGSIPPQLAALTSLQRLHLGGNRLSGSISPELAALTSLQGLHLGGNRLSGTIPPELAALTNLQGLDLRGNQLSGGIPKNLMQLSALTSLDIRGTSLCVPADAAFQAWLATLPEFLSTGLTCDGSLRVSFSASSYLLREGEAVELVVHLIDQTEDPGRSATIDLTATPGGGATKADYAGVPDNVTITAPARAASFIFKVVEDDHAEFFETVILGFGRPLPSGITKGDRDTATVTIHDPGAVAVTVREVLEELFHLTGGPEWIHRTNWLSDAPLGEWFGVSTDGSGQVTGLNLSDNQLSGTIPPALSKLTCLRELNLGGNQLSGPIPPELGQLTNLELVDLWSNQLSGAIPPELGGLTHLQTLNLSGNQLSGPIPPELGEMTDLRDLFLSGNQLSGAIPPELGGLTHLQWLSFWGNQLTGAIPPELGRLTHLQWLSLGGNQLNGGIPPELGGLAHLRWLSLAGNGLIGTIPPEFDRLTSLQRLDLRGNQLTGEIPPGLAGLTHLRELMLGFNQDLTGKIPPRLQQALLSTLDLMATSVCVPEDVESQEWLATIEFYPSGLTCGHPLSAMSRIDMALFYTPAARRIAGGTAEIEAAIDLRIAETNKAYLDSGVNQRLVLVAREEVEYTESGNTFMDLERFADRSDGHIDEIHVIRDQVGADLIYLIADSKVSVAKDIPSAVGLTCAKCSSRTFAHELGHNMGLHHDRYQSPHSSTFPYSHGYVNQQAFVEGAPRAARWMTIMAYPNQCSDAGFYCDSTMRFSNPNQTYRGDPLGVPGDERTAAVDGPADAVRTLNITRHSVASFRVGSSRDRLTISSPVSQSRSMVRAGGTDPPLVPVGDLFRPAAPALRGTASQQTEGALDHATLRRRQVSVDIQRLARVADGESTALRLNLFDDVVLTGIIDRQTPTYSGGYVLSGRLAGVTGGSMTLVVNGSVVAGTVRIPGATYRIRPAGTGRYAIIQVDPSKLPQACETVSPTTGRER